MRVAIITIGSELTAGRIIDANTGYLAHDLEQRGAHIALTLSVPDDPDDIAGAIGFALKGEPELLLLSGGLGPTHDDLTAASVAMALGLELRLDRDAEQMVSGALGATKLEPHQKKQAMLPAGSVPLTPAGTAPGFIVKAGGTLIISLPGVPAEMKSMWADASSSTLVAPVIKAAAARVRMTLCFYGAGEPDIGNAVESFLADTHSEFDVSICDRFGEVVLDVTGPEKYRDRIAELADRLRTRFAKNIFSDGAAIEEVVAVMMTQNRLTLAAAESCTGGMLGEIITAISGASQFFLGGVIAYDNSVKVGIIDVSQKVIDDDGAVSEAVAKQMAAGVRTALGSDYGIGITGVAGPDGGTELKPVGLVYISVSSKTGTDAKDFNFRGGRGDVRRAAIVAALHMLRRKLLAEVHS